MRDLSLAEQSKARRRRRAKKQNRPEAGRFRQQLRRVLEQANCLVWQAVAYEVFTESDDKVLLDEERRTRLHWDIHVVNQSASTVPSWLPVAREQGETIMAAWIRSRDPEDDLQASVTACEALHGGKSRYTQTFRNRMADGSIRWMYEDVQVTPMASVAKSVVSVGRDYSDGKPLRRWKLTGVVTDVTERKQTELALEAARAQLRQAMEQANCLLWQADVEEIFYPEPIHMPFDPVRGTQLNWDLHVINQSETEAPSWLPLYREQGHTTTMSLYLSRLPEDEAAASDVAREALWAGKTRYTQSFRQIMTDKSIRWLSEDVRIQEMPSVANTDGDGKPLRRWKLTGVMTDVTERKLAEEQQKTLAEQLQQVTEQANCLLWRARVWESSPVPDGWRVFDPVRNTRITWDLHVINETEVVRWLPLDRKEGESFGVAWNRARHPSDFLECNLRSRTALASGADRYTQVFRTFVHDGSVRWLQEDVRVELDKPQEGCCATGEPLRQWRLIGVVTDVTERKLAEERQKALADDLRQSNAALQEFAYVASHDLKEPLRKIQSFGNLLQRRAGEHLDADAQGYLDRMISAASRMQGLTQALLEFSRVAGKATEIAPIDLNTVASGVIQDLEVRIAEVGATVDLGHLPTVRADALQMRQLFQNLIANSLKFHHPDVLPIIKVTSTQDEQYITLRFADNGIGFSPDHADRIFQIFERLAGRSSPEGNGVGLAICKKIVERHGGTIVAEGCPDKGAIFTVKLPRKSPTTLTGP